MLPVILSTFVGGQLDADRVQAGQVIHVRLGNHVRAAECIYNGTRRPYNHLINLISTIQNFVNLSLIRDKLRILDGNRYTRHLQWGDGIINIRYNKPEHDCKYERYQFQPPVFGDPMLHFWSFLSTISASSPPSVYPGSLPFWP